jgi:type I restriction enzyme M protein
LMMGKISSSVLCRLPRKLPSKSPSKLPPKLPCKLKGWPAYSIFVKSQNQIQDPAKLYKIIHMIDAENWVMMGADVKGDIYEGLLEKNAEDVKSGAGQYFTPRSLIRTMVECIRPEPNKTIADPACGTGGFFLAAYDFLINNYNLDKGQKFFLKNQTFFGNEIVANARRLALMNMFLHNIGEITGESIISPNDSLIADTGVRYDYVLTNPPFGKKSSITITNGEGKQEKEDLRYNRQDFWATTSNKQLNFVQHVRTMLKTTGQAAVVVPDNVLFEGGAGETVRQKLLHNTSLDMFWIKDQSLADLDNLPDPDVLAEEIIENLEAGVASFKQIIESINGQ